jgi:S-adenosylmethionine:tRNA ribosyltransferase-isomerase
MLVLHRATGQIEHRQFRDLPGYLTGQDVVVLNNTRVIRARLVGRREPGGGRAEVLLLTERGNGLWEALVTPGRRIPVGRRLVFGDGQLRAEVVDRTPTGSRLLRFDGDQEVKQAIALLGEVPTPPYVHRPIEQESDYQTVYAEVAGASAAPTAGLHFTDQVLDEVRARVREVVYVTLHIGLGTFRPIHTDTVEEHDIHAEWFEVPETTAAVVSQALANDRRVIAVGTSTARALESACSEHGRLRAGAAETDLLILPGYRFHTVGALLTNFHMPRSTLLALVFAFAGRDQILRAYREAVEMRYRFLSFGDAMLIV